MYQTPIPTLNFDTGALNKKLLIDLIEGLELI